MRFVSFDVEHKEEVNTIGDCEVNVPSPCPEVNIVSHSGWLDPVGYYHVSGEVEKYWRCTSKFR